jgi:microcystin degradation protein MlrC
MKVFIAGLGTETNTFSPMPTGRLSYEESIVAHGDGSVRAGRAFAAPQAIWRKRSEERGWAVVESLTAYAQPAGRTVRAVYEEFRDEILRDLKAAMPDIVLLNMHGAMAAEGYDDCEGDLMALARRILGPKAVIGLEIDPHCHLTPQMMESATLIVCYKEYPHTDIPERAEDLFVLAADAAEGKTRPVMRDYDCRMIEMYFTPQPPMRRFVDDMIAREGHGGLLSLSLGHGFPWGDTAHTGTRMLAIADGDAALAERAAREFGERLWAMREDIRSRFPDISGALDRAEAANKKPIVLGDFADNAGGGAPADSTFVLSEVLKRGLKNVAIGIFWDPIVVRLAHEAGEGATLQVRLGGKMGVTSGNPLDLTVKVHKIARKGLHQMFGQLKIPLGNIALLEADGVFLLVNDNRSQLFDPDAFTQLGLDLSAMNIVVVKSSQHFYARFAPIAAEVIHMKTPGAITPDFASIPYTKRDGNYWPKVDNPWR